MTGITNHQEYYTQHYFESVLAGDLKDTLANWKTQAADHPDDVAYQEPQTQLKRLIKPYFRLTDQWSRSNLKPHDRFELQRQWLPGLLNVLGYAWRPQWKTLGETAKSLRIPVVAEQCAASGAPELWVVETLADRGSIDELSESPLSLSVRSEQFEGDPQADNPQIIGTPATASDTWEELLTKHLFAIEEPPRWVLLISVGQLVLVDRLKWAERRYLSFDLREIFNRREEAMLQTTCALLHRESTCPAEGLPLLDGLDENSHKNAFSVSEDLKKAIVESVEELANEAVWYEKTVRKKGIFNQPTAELERRLTRGCLTYLYRLLFCLYLEARPELGYLPVQSEEYLKGYSIESLRDLEMVELTDPSVDGYFLHESIRTLFHLIYQGRTYQGDQLLMPSERSQSIHDDFEIAPLKSHLFDPANSPIISQVRFRNKVLLKVLRRLSLGRQGTGRNRRMGRISYSALGINQLGAVYENLLSYEGFFAKEDLYEVKPAGEDYDPLKHAFFVTADQMEQGAYTEEERVVVKDPATDTHQLLRHERGRFIYRMAGRARKKSASYYTPESLTQCLVKYALQERLKGLRADDILKLTVCEMAVGSAAFLNEAVNQLADAYLQRKQKELGKVIEHDSYAQERQKVKMLLADNNVFGVDLNPTAVELAEVSLWLNTIFEGAFVPWFGLQLANGNSLIGARRETYATHLLLPQKGQGGAKARWVDEAPVAIPHRQSRPSDGVYHWLLGDPGMANYQDKVIKSLVKDELDAIRQWKKDFVKPHQADEVRELLELSRAADELFARHLENTRRIREQTTDTLQVWGQPKVAKTRLTSTRDKDKLWAREIKHDCSAYSRLKLAMDYWGALWFWPMEQANLLPTRQQFFTEMGVILGYLPGFDPATEQGEFDTLLVQIGNTSVELQQNELSLDENWVDVKKLCAQSPRLKLVSGIAATRKFFHWELEYIDLFADRGGFDLILGNPPWIKVEWNEGDLLSERNPAFEIRKLTAPQIAAAREAQLQNPVVKKLYFSEYIEFEGTQNFLNSVQNYPLLKGQQTNLYKCFLPRAWSLSSEAGVSGFLHPEGVYDDPKAGRLRQEIYPRLREHLQFQNELSLFSEVDHHAKYSVNIYGQHSEVDFRTIANLYAVHTVDHCFQHSGEGRCGGIKDEANNWNTEGHGDRVVSIGETELALFAKLYDGQDTPAREARLPALHTRQLLSVLEKFAAYPRRLGDLKGNYLALEMWHETNSQKDHTIRRETAFPESASDLILSGPHFFVGNPCYKTPRNPCILNSDYDTLDLEALPDDYLPRSNYLPDCDPAEYRRRTPSVPWDADKKVTDYYRLVFRRMFGASAERSLIPSIAVKQTGHIHPVISFTFKDILSQIGLAFFCQSLVADFYLKTTGRSDLYESTVGLFPLFEISLPRLIRVVALNCLTSHYADLWSECWQDDFRHQHWYGDDPRLNPGFFASLTPQWQRHCALRSDYARRWALVEIDVMVARELKLTLKELQSIYRVQFPVLRQNESDTWYDQQGRIVFTASKGLPGVGFSRPEWNDIKDLHSGTVSRTVLDTTLPTGPIERTLTYHPPFTRNNREHDYALIWRKLDQEEGEMEQCT